MIRLNASKCIRLLHKKIECSKCEDICPTDAIFIKNNPLPTINSVLCVGCGACDALCPTEAFSVDDFNPEKFLYDFVQTKQTLVSCKKNVPCIAALNTEYIISLALLNKKIVFDMGHCDSCEIAHKCKPQIVKNYEEASYILEAMLSDADIKLQNIAYKDDEKSTHNKRDLFRNIIKTPFEKEVDRSAKFIQTYISNRKDNALLKQKRVTKRREILLSAVKKTRKPEIYHVVDANELSFISSKLLDSLKCDACKMCYIVCPTGALTSDIRNSKIDFDASLCIKCNACHEVCEPNALTLSTSFNIKNLFSMQVENLIEFDVRNCQECGMMFGTNRDEKLCARCSNLN